MALGGTLLAVAAPRLDVKAFREILSDHGHRERDCAENPLLKWWGYSNLDLQALLFSLAWHRLVMFKDLLSLLKGAGLFVW